MRGLHTLAWRILAARPLRSILTMLGVALGVGILFAAQATNAGIDGAIDRTVADAVGRADLRVSAFRDADLTPDVVESISAIPGVDVAAPAIERRTFLGPRADRLDAAATGLAGSVTVLGIEPGLDGRIRDLVLVDGSALRRPDEPVALVTQRLAIDDGYRVGDPITIQGPGAPANLRVIGIVAGSGPLVGAGGRTVIVPIAVATSVFGTDAVSRVDLRLAPRVTADEVMAELEARLTEVPYVVASPRDLATSLRASTADLQATTLLIAAVALFVGAFLIFNTLSMSVSERIREVGLLRAAGASRRQVVWFVLVEAAFLGLGGTTLGLLIGLGMARLMAIYVGTLRGFPAEPLGPGLASVAIAAVVGVAVTLAAALEPAFRAGSISPIEALRARLDLPAGRRARLRWLVVVFAAVAGVGLLTWPAAAGVDGALRGLAVYGILLVTVLISPLLLPSLARLAGLPFAALARFEERLTRGSLARDWSRTTLTLGALTIGLAMVVALGWSAAAAKAGATAWLAEVIPGDEVVTAIRPIAPDEGVAETLADVPGVVRVTPVATFDLAVRGVRIDAAAISGADLLADGRLDFVAGDRSAALEALDDGGAVILPAALGDRLAAAVGDTMTVPIGGGRTVDLRVVGIVARSIPGPGGEAALVGWGDATDTLGVAGANFFAVRLDPARTVEARIGVGEAASALALEANPLSRVQGAVAAALARVFGLFDAIALVAVLMAGLGIINTLTIGVVDRVREIGVLRAIGMTRRQVSRMVMVEAGVLGIIGALLGSLAGLAVGVVMVLFADARLDLAASFPWASIAIAAGLGIAVSIAAAWYPARVASRVSIIRAVKFE